MSRLVAAVALVVMIAAGCSSGDDDEDASPSSSLVEREQGTSTTPAGDTGVAWTVRTPRVVAQPVVVGDVVVALGTRGRNLLLFGVSMRSGEVLWEEPASPGDVVPGIAVSPAVIGDTVVFFRPDRRARLLARLVALDGTGRQRWQSDPFYFESPPDRCFDDRDVCVDARATRADESRPLRFDLDSGAMREETSAPEGSRPVGPKGLVDLGVRGPEFLARLRPGGLAWRVPLAEAFSDQHSTDQGWHFEHFPDADAYVGSVGAVIDVADDAASVTYDLANVATAGLDAATGRVLWKEPGTQFLCFGTASPAAEDDTNYEAFVPPVRCRYRGMATFRRDSDDATFEGLDVVLEGFDVRTGATTWSVALGALESWVYGDELPPVAGNTSLVVRQSAGATVIDVLTGATRPVGDDEIVWCPRDEYFTYRELADPDDPASNERRGGRLFRTCTADGESTERLPRQIPEVVSGGDGRRLVVATPGGLVAYDVAG